MGRLRLLPRGQACPPSEYHVEKGEGGKAWARGLSYPPRALAESGKHLGCLGRAALERRHMTLSIPGGSWWAWAP